MNATPQLPLALTAIARAFPIDDRGCLPGETRTDETRNGWDVVIYHGRKDVAVRAERGDAHYWRVFATLAAARDWMREALT